MSSTLNSAGILVREAGFDDIDDDFLVALASLSDVGLTVSDAVAIFRERQQAGIRTYVARQQGRIVGTASLLMEKKFIHRGGLVGHIEDVAVHRDFQRQGIGSALVEHATEEACKLGCYKVILNCFDRLVSFYGRLGYRAHDVGLRNDC